MSWFKARDKLPALNGHYLTFDGGEISIAWYQCTNTGTLKQRAFYDDFNQQLDITHWMSLPEPPCIFHNVEEKNLETN